MPNKYSHALVLSHHEAQGLVDFDQQRSAKTPFQSSPKSKAKSKNNSRSNPSTPRSSNFSHAVSGPRPASSGRVRLESPSPPPPPPPPPPAAPPSQAQTPHPPLLRNQSSVDTQIYAPESSVPPPVQVTQNYRTSETRDVYVPTRLQPPPSKPSRESGAVHQTEPPHATQSYASIPSASTPREQIFWIEDDEEDLQEYTCRLAKRSDERFSDETEIYVPQAASLSPPASKHGSVTQGYNHIPRRPPTPPLTPQQHQTFSLKIKTYLDSVDPTQLHETTLAADSNPRSPPASSSDTRSASTSELYFQKSLRPRPRAPTAAARPARPLSISTRTSSLNATTAAPFGSWGSPISISFTSPTPSTVGETNHDDDLDSLALDLPSDLANDLDYQVLPWEEPINHPTPPFLSLPQANRPISTRASSFDSAAPPPIGMTRPLPRPLASHPTPRYLKLTTIPNPPTKKPNKSPLSFLKHSTPKTIPYSTTRPGRSPVPVAVSRTAAPSIPALFPNYKGPWPPPKSRTASADPPARRRSFLAGPTGTERRKSWFKTDTLDRTFGAAGSWTGRN